MWKGLTDAEIYAFRLKSKNRVAFNNILLFLEANLSISGGGLSVGSLGSFSNENGRKQ